MSANAVTARFTPTMIPRNLLRRGLPAYRPLNGRSLVQRRGLVAAPKAGSGPLMERRPDRELPGMRHSLSFYYTLLAFTYMFLADVNAGGWRWLRTAPIFIAILVSSTLAIFNYQKGSSSVVSSALYALRTSPKAREILGDDIYFAHQMPWIWGEMNQLHGRINIHFEVKGTKRSGTMAFRSFRQGRNGLWETTEWSLTTREDGKEEKVDLLEGNDPFQALEIDDEPKQQGRGLYAPPTTSS